MIAAQLFITTLIALLPRIATGAATIYLNDETGVTVGVGGVSNKDGDFVNVPLEQSLANIINLKNATDTMLNNEQPNTWWTPGPLELIFDLGASHELVQIHFWNYFTEDFDVDHIDFTFFDDEDNSIVGLMSVSPRAGENIHGQNTDWVVAETYTLEAPTKTRRVSATLTSTNGEIYFSNIGFTANKDQGGKQVPIDTPAPVVAPTKKPKNAPPSPAPIVPSPAPVSPAPASAAPVTAAPVTSAPVTSAPVTAAPITASPVTAAPITAAPTTATPSIQVSEFPSGTPSPSGQPSLHPSGSTAPSLTPSRFVPLGTSPPGPLLRPVAVGSPVAVPTTVGGVVTAAPATPVSSVVTEAPASYPTGAMMRATPSPTLDRSEGGGSMKGKKASKKEKKSKSKKDGKKNDKLRKSGKKSSSSASREGALSMRRL